jgi:hypothetical protein
MGYSKDDLAKDHKNCDQLYTTKVNRQFIKLIHNAMFPADSTPTPVVLRLQVLIDSSTVKGLMEGTDVGNEDQWDETHMWLIPSVTIWARLCFKYEGMTELINDRFIEDFGILLGSATGEAKTRKSFYEIDKEFEFMTKTIEKNFVKVDNLMVFMSVSLRQVLIDKLSKVGKDKEAWGKDEDHLAGLLNEDQMLTITDTDTDLKKCEIHIQRVTIENKTDLVATTTDTQHLRILLRVRCVTRPTTKLRSVGLSLRTKFEKLRLPLQKPRLRGRRSSRQRGLLPLSVRCSLLVLLRIHRTAHPIQNDKTD